jgi:hypothetical protein
VIKGAYPQPSLGLRKGSIVFVRCWRHDFRLLKSNLELRVNARVGYWILRYESHSVRPAEEVADDGPMDFKAAASLCFIRQRVAEVYDLVAGKLIQERNAFRLAPCQQLAAHELRLVVAEPVGFVEP